MPYASEAQRGFLHANEPEVARRWDAEYPHQGSLPEHVAKDAATDDDDDGTNNGNGTGNTDTTDEDTTIHEDPTVAFVHKFNDPSQWIIKKAVPVFGEHNEPGDPEQNEPPETFDEPALREISDNCNKLVASGNPPGLTLGHTFSKAKETDQPETVGYAKNFRVARSPLDGKYRIYQDEYYFPEKYAEALKYPYRSVERWKKGKFFKPIALLRREPALNLGVASYSADGDTVIRYSREVYAMPEPMETAQGAPPQAAPMPPAAEGPGLEPTDKDKELFHKLCMAHPMVGKMLKQYEGGAAAPAAPAAPAPANLSGTNGEIPAPVKKMEDEEEPEAGVREKDPKEMVPMQRSPEDVVHYARMDRKLKEMEAKQATYDAEIAQAKQDAKMARYSKVLTGLEAAGVLFDYDEEMRDCAPLDEGQFTNHIAKMQKYNARVNFGPPIRHAVASPEADDKKAARELDEVLQYLRKTGTDYDTAVKQYAGAAK